MFSGVPTITFGASIAVCQPCQLVSARVLEWFPRNLMFCCLQRDTCCFGDSAQPYAFGCIVVTASRCEVATHAATLCFWLRRLHELVHPWKRFGCLVMVLNPRLAKFWSQPFFLALLLSVSLLREAVSGAPPLGEAVVPHLCERRCWSRFREKHCCTNREV